MNLNNVTKSSLNAFVGKKIAAQVKEAQEQIKLIVDSKIDPVIKNIVRVKEVEKAASTFAGLYSISLEVHSDVLNWDYTSILQSINSFVIDMTHNLTKKYKKKVEDHVREPNRNVVNFKDEALNEATIEVQELTKPLYERITKLNKLRAELEHAIKIEHNGSRAYKALVALGVNMEGFEETNSNLPAVVKLSVDVCLMNGTCEEKSA